MKRLLAILFAILTLGFTPSASAASDPSLYFENAIFDYYLEKTDTGTKMKVKETLDAVFSTASSSHGPTRIIPFTNQAGKNITIKDLKITATRNGVSEPIAKAEKKDGYYEVNIGTSSKTVQGKQTYVLEYEFENVITEYDTSGKDTSGAGGDHQELYWDTNGTGWFNEFNSVVANVHFAENYPVKEPAYCYTGAKNSKEKNCTVERTKDGFTFRTTKKLGRYENMTFDIEFPADTFLIPLEKNYFLVFATALAAVLGVLTVFFSYKKYCKYAKAKRAFAKNLLVAPQYTPMKDLTVAEAGLVYLDNTKPTQTATILELATSHKIQIIGEKTESKVLKREKTIWKIQVLEDNGLTSPQEDVLKILNGGELPKKEETIEIKKQTATSHLAKLAREYTEDARTALKRKKFLEEDTNLQTGSAKTHKEGALAGLCLAALLIGSAVLSFLMIDDDYSFLSYGHIYGRDFLPIVIWGIAILTLIIYGIINSSCSKYLSRTNAGLEASNYLEGLKLYISMAEKERIEFSQSAKNAPKDDKARVKLYEKLLPYACLFGLEESWLKEIQKYYDALDYEPDWYYGSDPFTYAMFYSMMSHTTNTISNNTAWHSSSSSSGFSGGGGGGFSGGGGGGGGGGSW